MRTPPTRKILAPVILALLAGLGAYLLWDPGADDKTAAKSRPQSKPGPKLVIASGKSSLPALHLPAPVLPPVPVAPASAPSGANQPDQNISAMQGEAEDMSNLLAAGDFKTFAELYLDPQWAGDTVRSLEWLRDGPAGQQRIQMLVKAFDSMSAKAPTMRSPPDTAVFHETTIYHGYLPGGEGINTLPVFFHIKDGHWQLSRDSFGLLIDATRNIPLD